MKDAVERITANGNSWLLLQLVDRIGSVTYNLGGVAATSIMEMTRVGAIEEESSKTVEGEGVLLTATMDSLMRIRGER